jgi:putative transposase
MVQQQALRDFTQAMANFFDGKHGRPSWRKAGRNEGFRIVAVKPGHVRRLSRHIGRSAFLRWAGSGSAGPAPCPKG